MRTVVFIGAILISDSIREVKHTDGANALIATIFIVAMLMDVIEFLIKKFK